MSIWMLELPDCHRMEILVMAGTHEDVNPSYRLVSDVLTQRRSAGWKHPRKRNKNTPGKAPLPSHRDSHGRGVYCTSHISGRDNMPSRISWNKIKYLKGDPYCMRPSDGNTECMKTCLVGDSLDPFDFHQNPTGGSATDQIPVDNVTPQELQEQIQALLPEIHSNYAELKLILERHDTSVCNRWRKRNRTQKVAILEKAWGGPLSAHHNEHFKRFTCWKKDTVPDESWYEAFMWPYVNKEDLTKVGILPMFLHSRACNDPTLFVARDLNAMHLGRLVKVIKPIHLESYLIGFRDPAESSPYAILLYADPSLLTHEHMPDRLFYVAGEGILILEAQARLLSFLKNCAVAILSDIPIENLYGSLSQTKLRFDYTDCSAATILAETPYRTPQPVDYAGLAALIAAKKDASAEHLLALRDDPAYFSQSVRERWDEKGAMQAANVTCARCQLADGSVLWGRILGDLIGSAITEVEIWTVLHEQSRRLQEFHSSRRATTMEFEMLAREDLENLLTFRFLLSRFCELMMMDLKELVELLPAWKHFEEACVKSARGGGKKLPPRRNSPATRTEREDLFYLLRLLFPRNAWLLWFGTTIVIDEIQRCLESSSSASKVIGTHIDSVISDISIIIHCLRQTDVYKPWYSCIAALDEEFYKTVCNTFLTSCSGIDEIQKQARSESFVSLGQLGNPSKVDFRYPVNKRRDKDAVDMMRNAEANLRKFWVTAEETCLKDIFKLNKAAEKVYLEPPSLPATPEWTELCKPQTSNNDPRQEICKPLNEMYLDLQERTESTLSESKPAIDPRTKIKSRGSATTKIDEPENESHKAHELHDTKETTGAKTTRQVFEVNSRTIKVFKTLFFTDSPTATPGEVDWSEFLHAMTSIGFQAKKLHGSMWQFSPTKTELRRSIIFHEPHPCGKIPYHTARRHGRRLTKVYGWTADTFELAKKAKIQVGNTMED